MLRTMVQLSLTWGLMALGSPPRVVMASLMAARSTTAGTPVKSCTPWHKTGQAQGRLMLGLDKPPLPFPPSAL